MRFSVIDTGISIAADKLNSVFGAFEQADQSTTRKYGGTGLGLAISKKLVAAMGGDLRVESAPGDGAHFQFSLPLAQDARDVELPRQPAPRRAVLRVGGAATTEALACALVQSGFAVEALAPDAALSSLDDGDLLVLEAKAILSAQRRLARGPLIAIAELGDGGAERVLAANWADCVLERPLALEEIAMICATLRDGAPLAERRRAGRCGASFAQHPGRKVLVADDNAVNREVASAALQRFGVEIDLVEDGAQAVAAIGRRRYDLVLMDGSMPELDGFEATRLVRASEAQTGAPRLPIVALTAHVVGAGAQAWREAGMDGVLRKPFTLHDLAEVLTKWLGGAPAFAAPPAPVAQDACESETPVLDPAVIDQLRQLAAAGKPEFLHRVCGLYRQHAPENARQIAAAFAAGDADAVGRLAHGLKSMSYNMGASRVAAAALHLERCVREDKRQPEARAITALEEAVGEALEALNEIAPLDQAA
jgi:two-component system sensor histidine kinase BarA